MQQVNLFYTSYFHVKHCLGNRGLGILQIVAAQSYRKKQYGDKRRR